jgi:hypothetical protein
MVRQCFDKLSTGLTTTAGSKCAAKQCIEDTVLNHSTTGFTVIRCPSGALSRVEVCCEAVYRGYRSGDCICFSLYILGFWTELLEESVWRFVNIQ